MLPTKGWAKDLDNKVRALAKKAFQLPRRTTMQAGGLGLPNIEDEVDIAWASQAVKYLCSKDDNVIAVAVQGMKDTIKARTDIDPSVPEALNFLNS